MLVLDTEYINAVSYAARYNSPDMAEWPPHPDRLFMAMVSAWGAAGQDGRGADALRWLERQGPPEISAPPATRRGALRSFVPTSSNGARGQDYLDGRSPVLQLGRGMVRKDRLFPAAILPDDRTVVSMVWRDADPDDGTVDALNDMASRVSYVGHSASLTRVRASTRTDVEGLSHVPYVDGAGGGAEEEAESDFAMLRCPGPGRFDALVAEYGDPLRQEAGLWPSTAPARRYTAPPVPVHDSLMGPAEEWLVFSADSTRGRKGGRRRGGFVPALRTFPAVAKALRNAMMSCAEDPVHEIISGHAPDGSPAAMPHMAVVPLANVGWGRAYSDGSLMGMAIVLPRGSGYGTPERRQLWRAAAEFLNGGDGMDGEEGVGQLRLGRFGTMHLRDGAGSHKKSLHPDRYAGVSRAWASVTPVVLDRHVKKMGAAPDALADCCVRAGLPRPARVQASPHSRVAGAPGVLGNRSGRVEWRSPKNGRFGNILLHAVIEFDEAVRGPVLVGSGRYFGMGLFMPHRDGGGRHSEDWTA